MEARNTSIKRRIDGSIVSDPSQAKSSRAQEQIYAQISRGLTDVLTEYELLGDFGAHSDAPRGGKTGTLFPTFLQQTLGLTPGSASNLEIGDPNGEGSNEKL